MQGQQQDGLVCFVNAICMSLGKMPVAVRRGGMVPRTRAHSCVAEMAEVA